jgi:hypothetical protein
LFTTIGKSTREKIKKNPILVNLAAVTASVTFYIGSLAGSPVSLGISQKGEI